MKKVVVGKSLNKKYIIRCLACLIILIILLCFLIMVFNKNVIDKKVNSDNINPYQEENVPTTTSLSLTMVGDALIHGAVYGDANKNGTYDFKPMLAEMKPIISSFDLAYYNQETILGGTEIGVSTYPTFNSPYEVGDAFLDAGFNLVSLANNHTLDRGEQALINSCNYWKDKDVLYAGSYCSEEDRDKIIIKEKNGIKYALLSYTTVDNGIRVPGGKSYYLNKYNAEIVKQDVEKYRDKVDLLMVAMHWGQEYTHTPINSQKEIATYLASLGVDIIIGTHPHVVEPIEFIDKTLVIYSLGNFISAQRGVEKLTGLMVSLDVNKDLINDTISLDNVEAELLYTYSDYSRGYRKDFKVYPYTKLNNNLLSDYNSYYNMFMNYVVGDKDYIRKGDYSGNSE